MRLCELQRAVRVFVGIDSYISLMVIGCDIYSVYSKLNKGRTVSMKSKLTIRAVANRLKQGGGGGGTVFANNIQPLINLFSRKCWRRGGEGSSKLKFFHEYHNQRLKSFLD
jgi:hypothetical protein